MANHQIPIIDRQTVIGRMAEGQSTRMAIQGTAIKSNQTAARLAKRESHTITRLRKEYIEQVNHFAVEGQKGRAAMLADMVWADKVVRIGSVSSGGLNSLPTRANDCYITVPDWEMRLKAIKYIDQLAGLMPVQGMQVNMVQQIKNSDYYT